MSDIPKLTPELELDMKRTLLMLAAKQSGVKITNVYVKNKDGTITDEVKKYVIQDPEGSTERTSRRENIEKENSVSVTGIADAVAADSIQLAG